MVEQIRRLRTNKINSGLEMLQGPMTVKLNNLSAMECNVIRPFFQGNLDRFYKLSQVIAAVPSLDLLMVRDSTASADGSECFACQMEERRTAAMQQTSLQTTQPSAWQSASRALRRATMK